MEWETLTVTIIELPQDSSDIITTYGAVGCNHIACCSDFGQLLGNA